MTKQTLAEKVYQKVREDIANKKVLPGQMLVENDICRSYGVSKATAGEVLHRLTQEGILKSYPRKGYQLNVYDEVDFRKIQELRYAMEALVVHKIIIGTDNGKLKRRFSQTEKMENADFHMELARMVDDPFILEALEKLLLKADSTYKDVAQGPEVEAAFRKRHRTIIERLLLKDEAGALGALREDLRIDGREEPQEQLDLSKCFTTSLMADMVYLNDPQLSADGKRAAVTRFKARVEDGRFYAGSILVDLKTSEEMKLGAGENVKAVRFAPDGSFVSYLSDESGELQLYIQYEDGTVRKLSSLRHGITRYELSPTGDRFVFEAALWPEELKGSLAIKEMTKEEKEEWLKEREWAPMEITEIDYKRDECYGVRDGSLSVIGTVDLLGNQRLLTDEIPYTYPSFSPDGQKIACYGNPHKGAAFSRKELFVLDTVSGKQVKLTEGERLSGDVRPLFTADGESVIYPAWYSKEDCSILYLYRRNLSGGEAVNLFDPEKEEVSSGAYGYPLSRTQYGEEKPWFYAQGEKVWFLCAWKGKENLYQISVKGKSVPKLYLEGDYSIHEFCLPVKGKLLLTRGDYHTIRELYLYDSRGGEFKRLLDSNPWLKGCRMGEVAACDILSLDGKTSVHGWVCKPADFVPGEKYPAVLYIHGGPEVCYTNDFWHEIQALSGAGFAVVYCDPRGSAGYGLRFASNSDSWGEAAYEDLMGFLDYAVSLGFIDEDQLGITGGSYGGYTTCKIIMRNHRFRAAVAQRTFVNKATSYGTGDMGFYSAGMDWSEVKIKDCLLERSRTSIIRGMDQIDTPLLLLHGYQDYRCSFEQSEQMFVSMHQRRPEVPVRLVMFPGENHGVSRTGLLHFQQRHVQEMIDWFTRFLKEGADGTE
ncbi:MAG: prolyl oligopeptidase family serine peptidase [Lachnospiraceae bacterium]|nr:prolyl oligopeptidase family serine peptidase [Lachnospiraceae bacterium]